jgi:CRISPR-associated protein Cst2
MTPLNGGYLMNLFATVLTYPAPSANYRGESELNRSVIQKVTDGRFDYPIISPEAMRNALREILAQKYKLPCNRERLHDEDQLAVKFSEYPNPEKYADDFLLGYFIAASGKERKEILAKVKRDGFTFKRDSVLRMNLAKALEPYRHNAVFTQSPLAAEGSAYQNASTSALLHRETAVTAFQYPFAINIRDCKKNPTTADWTRKLLQAIGELNEVAGNHARSYFEMAPASIIVRLTSSLVAGFNTYCFKPATEKNPVPDILEDIIQGDCGYPGKEFFVAGEIVKRGLPQAKLDALRAAGVTLDHCPRKLLAIVADKALGG